MAHDVWVPLSLILMLAQGDLWRRVNATEDIEPVEAAWRAVSRVLLDAIVLPGLDDNDDMRPDALYNVNTAALEYVSVPLPSVEPSSASPTHLSLNLDLTSRRCRRSGRCISPMCFSFIYSCCKHKGTPYSSSTEASCR